MILDSLSPEPDLFSSAQRWAGDHHPMSRLRSLRDGWRVASEAALWSETGALGWHGTLVPEALGGVGGTLAMAATLAEAQGECLFAAHWIGHAVQAVTVLQHCPPSHRRDTALRGAVASRLAALPCERSHAAPNALRATARSGGWQLDGEVGPTPGAGQAWQWLVLTSTHDPVLGQAAPTQPGTALLFLVNPRSSGIAVGDGPGLDGRRVAGVRMDGATPIGEPLAVGAEALSAWQAGADAASLAMCAEACGLARLALRLTLEHLRTRQQFGQPLARFQALQHRAAEMAVACAYASAHVWGALCAHEAMQDATSKSQRRVSRSAQISAARVEVLRNARYVVEQAVQLHGGLGVSDELAVSHAFKRIICIEALLGDRQAHLATVADSVLGAASPTPA